MTPKSDFCWSLPWFFLKKTWHPCTKMVSIDTIWCGMFYLIPIFCFYTISKKYLKMVKVFLIEKIFKKLININNLVCCECHCEPLAGNWSGHPASTEDGATKMSSLLSPTAKFGSAGCWTKLALSVHFLV